MVNAEQQNNGRFYFLLLSNFSVLSLSTALETLRIANRVSSSTQFDWALCSEAGAPVLSSLTLKFPVDGGLPELRRVDAVFVCSGANVVKATTKPILNWLRYAASRGASIGGLCTGAYVLAKAGILDGKKTTIHWENQASFEESFPDVELTDFAFVIDGKRSTTAGGTAAIDLMLKMISERTSEKISDIVAQQLLYLNIRILQNNARTSNADRLHIRNPKLSWVIRQMETNLENPIKVALLAKQSNISTRQLERLFKRYVSETPGRYYLELRLSRARNLLTQTEMSIINVALASGFSSAAHSSKNYKQRFGVSPYIRT